MALSFGVGYRRLLWGSMAALGIDRSLERKIMAAVGIQFGVSVIQAFLPTLFPGDTRLLISGLLLVGAALAFANTLLIARHDIIHPIEQLERTASAIARGDLAVEAPEAENADEIGSLQDSFAEMHGYFETVSEQAAALASHRFEDSALDEDLPGRFGYLLSEMASSLRSYVGRIESDRDRFKLLNYLVSHDISNILTVLEGYTAQLRERTEDETSLEYLDIIDDQAAEIESVIETVRPLTDSRGLEWVDLGEILRTEVETLTQANDLLSVTGLDAIPSGLSIRANRLLASVFRNVLTNAVEHNDADEPEIHIDVSQPAEDLYSIDIADNGPGLPADRYEDFFETAEPGSGTDIIRTVVARFDGDIWVEPNEPRGTVVRILLPRDHDPLERADGSP